MTFTIDASTLSFLVVGLVAGTAAAMVADRQQKSYRFWLRNLAIGVIGAFLGSLIFSLLNLEDNIPAILAGTITLSDILIAFVGGVLLIWIARLIRQ